MAEPTNHDEVTSASITTDADGWFKAVSPAFLGLIERDVAALAGLNVIDLVHPHDAANVRRAIHEAAANGTAATTAFRFFGAGDRWHDTDAALAPTGTNHQVTIGLTVIQSPIEAPSPTTASNAVAEREPFTFADQGPAVVARVGAESIASVTAPAPIDPTTTSHHGFPGDEVPMQRAAIRARAGGSSTPMIEIDTRGRTTFVSGLWESLSGDQELQAPAFEQVLEASGQSDTIAQAMGQAFDHAASTRIEMFLPEVGQRYAHVLPIPSPHRQGEVHALVAVTVQPELGDLEVAPVAPPPIVTGTPVPPSAIEALTRVTETVSTTVTPVTPAGPATSTDPGGGHGPESDPELEPEPEPQPSWTQQRATAAKHWMTRRDLSYGQLGAAIGVVVVALVLRFWDLAALPAGFHGDEGITGQEAQRVLDNGSIGVYTGSALGQPTAPFYLYAIGVGLFGNTVWATRSIAALGGVAAVALIYLVVQKRFDHRTAVAAAFAMATMTWTLHFSRIAFGLAWWPVVIIAATAAIDRATKSMTGRHWFVAGAVVTLGIYVYNSHVAFGAAVALFGLIWLATKRSSLGFAGAKALVWAPIGALIIGLPMITYALDETNGFSNHFTLLSRRNTDEWKQAGFFDQVELFAGWYIDAWDALLVNPIADGVDASGVIKQVPWVFTLFAVVGLVQVLRTHRTAFTGLLLVTLVVMPIAPALTFNAQTRRDFAMAPAIAILAGIGAVAVLTAVGDRLKMRNTNGIALALVVTVFFTSVIPYFTTFRNDGRQQWVFANELTVAADGVQQAEANGPVFVNWYSARHYYDYPTLEFLLGDTPGANRAPLDQGFNENPPLGLADGVTEDQVYVLVGDYGNNLEQLQTMFPEGRLVSDSQNPRVVVFEVPAARS